MKGHLGSSLTRPLLLRIEKASRSNPFYAIEVARALAEDQDVRSAGEFPFPDDIRDIVAFRVGSLPPPARLELLRAAAHHEPSSETLDLNSLAPAIAADLIVVRADGRVEFTHPLFESAVMAMATGPDRRQLHRELAQTSPDPETKARHLALATDEPDAAIADELDRAADLARRRGAPEVAAELAEQSAKRTPPDQGDARVSRLLRAARLHFVAGDPARTTVLAHQLLDMKLSRAVRAGALCVLAETYVLDRLDLGVALLNEARPLADEPALIADIELGLGLGSIAASDFQPASDHFQHAIAYADQAGANGVLAQALACFEMSRFMLGHGFDEAAVERALILEKADEETRFQQPPSLLAAQLYAFDGQVDRSRQLLVSLRERTVATGEEASLPGILAELAATSWLANDFVRAEEEADDALASLATINQGVMYAFALATRAVARAIRGDAAASRLDADEARTFATRADWFPGIVYAALANAELALSQEDWSAAAAAVDQVAAKLEQSGTYDWPLALVLPNAIEACIATGDLGRAGRLIDGLRERGLASGHAWASAVSWRTSALLLARQGDLDGALEAASQALVEHEQVPMPFELARTLLVAGRIQRRAGERRAARESLRRATDLFERLDAPHWAEQARRENARIGVRRAPVDLTENERLMAELASQGRSNREIAAQMFVSARTVDANLARAYGKLGIGSRAQLGAALTALRKPPNRKSP